MKTILIDFDNEIVKTALVEDSKLIELFLDNRLNSSIVGNIYLGVVKNVLKNQFLFIDIGISKNVFLDLSDQKEKAFCNDYEHKFKPNDHILVQITRDETGEKGAAATTQISVSNSYIVLFKNNFKEIGISKKIENITERKRLRKMLTDILPENFSAIIRTGCIDISEDELLENVNDIVARYEHIIKRAEFSTAPNIIQKEEYFLANTIRMILTKDIQKVIINDKNELEKVQAAAYEIPVEIHEGDTPIFSEHFLTKQIEEAFSRKVWLKSGGFIVIDHAEAGVLIDVNSGKFIGKSSQQKTALKVDREAAVEIARQIRLRNLSGMILIDFIDLRFEENRVIIMKELENELKKDRLSVSIVGMIGQGLVMLTRKKTREPIVGL